MEDAWITPIGAQLTRDDRMALYGGAKYGGIEPSAGTPNVFLYSDPATGETYGYNFDGWSPDGTVFFYTGDGRVGDQLLKVGNRSVADHRDSGNALRLFIARGKVGSTNTKIHEYIGEFELDPHVPYETEEAPDQNGEFRTVLVFRLLPIGEIRRDDRDRSQAAANVAGVPEAQLVPIEAMAGNEFEVPGTSGVTATRIESQLVARYTNFLEASGHSVRRWRLLPRGEMRPLFTDIYDEQALELCEAKGTATRESVRTAIGQLLDYRRYIPVDGLRLAVLLPHRPSDDLVDLVAGLAMSCIYESQEGGFSRV